MTNQTPKMLWYLQVCIQLLVLVIAVFFNVHLDLWEKDATKLSFFIIGMWAVSSALIGYWHFLTDPHLIRNQAKIGWYLAETCLAIGMVGTVAGFLMMLGTAFSNIDVSNVSSLQQALASMAVGMSTALYTTLVGLIASIFLKSQLVNLEHLADGLE